MKRILYSAVILLFLTIWGCSTNEKDNSGELSFRIFESFNQVHILANEEQFASYLYDTTLLKPVLFPVYSASHVRMQRLFPLKTVDVENHDHPHHVGVFFTYGSEGEVNGNSFWAGQDPGTKIKHMAITREEAGPGNAILGTRAEWIGKEGNVLLTENRTMVFSGNETERSIDFTFNMEANGQDVVFGDTKEGMFAIRVAHWLTEDSGTGRYLNSEGDTAEANVWGKRASWVRLEGTHEGKVMGIIILNHPSSVNYPTYWHARGYGLFAANPLGQSVFERSRGAENAEPFNFRIAAGDHALFRFKMIIYEGHMTPEQIGKVFTEYSS